jgi:hypothetical protein
MNELFYLKLLFTALVCLLIGAITTCLWIIIPSLITVGICVYKVGGPEGGFR